MKKSIKRRLSEIKIEKKEKERVGREKSKNLWWCISTNSVEKGGIYVAAAVALE